MSQSNFTKSTDRATFAGYPDVAAPTQATKQNADWANVTAFTTAFTDVLTTVPAASRVTVSGAGVTGQNGQYTLSLSLSGTNTCQLTPGLTDAEGNVSPNPLGTFTYKSRCQQVTCDASGNVSAVSRTNGAVIEIEYPRSQVTIEGPSMPAPTEKIYATLVVRVLS